MICNKVTLGNNTSKDMNEDWMQIDFNDNEDTARWAAKNLPPELQTQFMEDINKPEEDETLIEQVY